MCNNSIPKISVIVPVYKAEQYLHRCVDSILSQSFADFELILVDDGSPDNSGLICDEYASKDSRVKVIHKANGGVSTARNVGIENAKGEWIAFIDADDYIEQGFLSIPKDATEDLLIQNYKLIIDGEFYSKNFDKCVVTSSGMKTLVNENIAKRIYRVPWAKFFKKTIIDNNNIKFAEGVKIGEDTLFVLDYLCFTKSVRYLSGSSYMYRKEESETLKKYSLPLSKCLEIVHLFIQRYDKLGANSVSFLNFTNAMFYNLIYPRDYVSLVKWHCDEVIIRICKSINVDYGFKWAVKYGLYLIKQRILGRNVN